MAQPWSFSFAFGDEESDSDDGTATNVNTPPMQGVQFGQQPIQKELSDDARLALELDLSTRNDTALFLKTPWTVAKANAASRPTRSSPANIHHAMPSTPDNHNQPKEGVLHGKNLTGHFKRELSKQGSLPKRNSTRKEKLESTSEPAHRKSEVIHNKIPRQKGDMHSKDNTAPNKQSPATHKRAFISPFKRLPQPLSPNHEKSHKQSVQLEPEDLPAPEVPAPSVKMPLKFVPPVCAIPHRSIVKDERITPTMKNETSTPTARKAGDIFLASTPLVHASPVKRKCESSPSELLPAFPNRPQQEYTVSNKRSRKEDSSPLRPPPAVKLVPKATHRTQGALAYNSDAFGSSNDDSWSTLQVKKKLPPPNIKNSSSSKHTTEGFRLPTTFLGVTQDAGVRGKTRPPRRTLLTLYQPPPPLPSSRPRTHFEQEKESASDGSEETRSGGSGGSDDTDDGPGFARVAAFSHSGGAEEGNSRFTDMSSGVWQNGHKVTVAEEGAEGKERFVTSVELATLEIRFPMLARRLRERHSAIRVPLSDLLGMNSCGVVWDDKWTEQGGEMRIPVFRLPCTDGYSEALR